MEISQIGEFCLDQALEATGTDVIATYLMAILPKFNYILSPDWQ